MKLSRHTILAIVFGFALCWFVGNGCAIRPEPPLANRPVLRWIAKAAKSLLWVAVFVEHAPEEEPPATVQAMHQHGPEEIGADGFPMVKHSRGW